tara:strand:- start:489 stop:626 length:138 start_codon:yes stop_codon:yes gene_type:complete
MYELFGTLEFRTRTAFNWTLVNSMGIRTGFTESEHHPPIIIEIKR